MPNALAKGAFITIEGGEGGGKSTQARALASRLRDRGVEVELTREPGGSDAAELIRRALLDGTFEPFGITAEALLFAAARIDHLDATIKPALSAGRWVVCDRFHDSTRAYQGAHGGVEANLLQRIETLTLDGTSPDLTLILDLPAPVGLARAARRRADRVVPDRFEKQSLQFHEDLRAAFLSIAAREPDRCLIVDAGQAPEDVTEAIWHAVSHRLAVPPKPST